MPLATTISQARGDLVRWFHEDRVEDEVRFRVGRSETGLVAEWPGLATLACASDGTQARLTAASGVSRRALAKLRSGHVRTLLRDLAGELGLHASAVSIQGRAVVFLGPSGAGKSTAAAEMCFRHGAQLLADDATALEIDGARVRVLPSERRHWLTPDSCRVLEVTRSATRDKRAVRPATVARQAIPLVMVVALRFDPSGAAPAENPLRGSQAARWLLEAAVRFDVEDARARRRELEQVTSVYEHATCIELVRPADAPGPVASWVFRALSRPA